MKKDKATIIPIRMGMELNKMVSEFQNKTGLNKSFIIRRCCNYALKQFNEGKIDILTLEEKR